MALKNNFLTFFRLNLLNLLWIVVAIYCFLVFIPIPWSPNVGLDPSWQYGISRAAVEKLIFGQDIIFTYGPLGYLIHGSVLEENFWSIIIFRFLVHFALVTVTSIKILVERSNIVRLSIALSILFAYFRGLSTDYQLLLTFLIVLSFQNIWESKSLRVWSIGIGAFSGFCLLTKFTLGIYTFGSLTLILLSIIYRYFQSKYNLKNACLALFEAFMAAISVAFILLNPNYISSLNKIFLCIIASVVFTLISKFAYGRLFTAKSSKDNLKTANIPIINILFDIYYAIALLLTVSYSSPSLLRYLKTSWQISSGYSSAMSIVGSPWELLLAASQISLILVILFYIVRENMRNLSIALVMLLVLFLSFKHGFVRQDGHIMIFFTMAPFIVALCISRLFQTKSSQVKINGVKKFVFALHLYTLIVLSLINNPSITLLENLAPTKVVNNALLFFNLNNLKTNLQESSDANLSEIKLPARVKKILGNKSVDIVPWEISLVKANNLNWKPRPIFQSYSAYTSFLDRANLRSHLENPRDYIIYSFSSIDGRHPFFDEPETFFNIYCNYKLSPEIQNLINIDKIYNLIILEKRSSSICLSGTNEQKISIPWNINQPFKISDTSIARVEINIKYSILGKIYKTFFRNPPVKIDVTYMDNSINSYRIIPENAMNGVVISNLPKSEHEALMLFQGYLPNRIKSFKFSNINPILYSSKIEGNLNSYKLADNFVKEDKFIDISSLKGVQFLDKKMDSDGVLDTKNKKAGSAENLKTGSKILLSGWAVNKDKEPRIPILLTYGPKYKPLIITRTGKPRIDVAKHFQNDKYTYSGWSIYLNSQEIPQGIHDLRAWIYDPNTNAALPLNGNYRVKVY